MRAGRASRSCCGSCTGRASDPRSIRRARRRGSTRRCRSTSTARRGCSASGITSRGSPGRRPPTTRPNARRCARAATSGSTRIDGRPRRPRSSRPRCGIPASTRPTGRCWAGARRAALRRRRRVDQARQLGGRQRVLGRRPSGAGRAPDLAAVADRAARPGGDDRGAISGSCASASTSREILCDPYQLHRSITTLKGAGLPIEEFPQTPANTTRMGQVLFDLLTGKNLTLYTAEDLRAQALHTVAVESPRGWRIAKERAAGRSTRSSPWRSRERRRSMRSPWAATPVGRSPARHDARSIVVGGAEGRVQYRGRRLGPVGCRGSSDPGSLRSVTSCPAIDRPRGRSLTRPRPRA